MTLPFNRKKQRHLLQSFAIDIVNELTLSQGGPTYKTDVATEI
jgi:hypothetical protein